VTAWQLELQHGSQKIVLFFCLAIHAGLEG
jgi:hypothetical protein